MYDIIQNFIGYIYNTPNDDYEFIITGILLLFAGWFGLLIIYLIFAFLGNLSKRI